MHGRAAEVDEFADPGPAGGAVNRVDRGGDDLRIAHHAVHDGIAAGEGLDERGFVARIGEFPIGTAETRDARQSGGRTHDRARGVRTVHLPRAEQMVADKAVGSENGDFHAAGSSVRSR